MSFLRTYPIIGALVAQLVAAAMMIAFRLCFGDALDALLVFWIGVALYGCAAALLTYLMGLARWWVVINLLFALALMLALSVDHLPAWPFGVVFMLLYLFFSNTARERVPLYLSNAQTAHALLTLMKARGAQRFVDLGSGLGGVVRALDGEGRRARGVESAPMVWLVSLVLSRLTGRGEILRQNIWSCDISQEDLVYAFLSSEPMPALYAKVKAEMKPGSLLVSNSFPVPGVEPDEVWELPDRRKTKLFLYFI